MGVRFGVEFCANYPPPGDRCYQPDLSYSAQLAMSLVMQMRQRGHSEIFVHGDAAAWSSDFDHPDFGGNSLNKIDNVHFCYYSGHGGHAGFDGRRVQVLGFTTNHAPPGLAPCHTMSAQWRLGVGQLKWFLLDSCVLVKSTDANHVVEVWDPPTQGVHLLLGVIDLQYVGPNTYWRRVRFVDAASNGWPLTTAWLDTAYGAEYPNWPVTRPIVIAAGATRDEALNRLQNETLGWAFTGPSASNWLAWRWRQ
ncbi:DUF6345 domain-containing protein [Plantactinospora sp. GCM10030261]|uniref:DUF6345 domain-containing protein n=1 Tax=Plantactinospora sp. GCM10030261 TaxID=3273420 RepID=UPI00360D03CE